MKRKQRKSLHIVKEVSICDPNYNKIRRTFALNISLRIINTLRSDIKHLRGCFIRYPNTLNLDKKTFLKSTSQCLNLMETLFLV